MTREAELLRGNITRTILKLSLPIMGTAFIQMAYSLTDIMWLGRLSTGAVAAVGTTGFFVWVAEALTLVCATGVSVSMAQAYGRDDKKEVENIMRAGFFINFAICFLITSIYLIFMKKFIGFYHLEKEVEEMTLSYFRIVTLGLVFTYSIPLISATFFAKGNSYTPFKISLIALIFNIVVDPILIFGLLGFPKMGIKGAAIATVLAKVIGVIIYIFIGNKTSETYRRTNYLKKIEIESVLDILHLGIPSAFQSMVHALVGIVLNKYISLYGAAAIAVYSIGSQIESISWMTADGLAKAFSAFTGQNYGAKKFDRLHEGKRKSLKIVFIIGIITTLILYLFPRQLFSRFVPGEIDTINMGVDYLKILAISQLFMAIEIGTAGILNGLGMTKYPAMNGMIFNVMRIPFAIVFMSIFELNGIWLSMSLSSILKGIFLVSILYILDRKTKGFRMNMSKYSSRVKAE